MPAAAGWIAVVVVVAAGLGALVVDNAALALALVAAVAVAILLAKTWRRFRPAHASVPAAPWVIELAVFPLVCALRTFSLTAATVAIGVTVLYAWHKSGRTRRRFPRWALIVLAATFGGLLAERDAVRTSLFAVLALVLLTLAARRATLAAAVSSLIDGVGLYLVASVVGYYVLGLRSPGEGLRLDSSLQAAGGGVRVLFPLSTNLSVPPAMAAMFVAASLILLEQGWRRLLRLAGLAAAVAVLIGSDTRSALVLAALIAVCSLLRPTILRRIAVPVGVVTALLPFVYPQLAKPIIAPIIGAVTTAVPGLSRPGESSDVSLNGRAFIWQQATNFWADYVDLWHRMVGYGQQGQIKSGVVGSYESLFVGGFLDPGSVTVHHSVFQQLFDAGLVGAVGLAAIMLIVLSRLASADRASLPAAYGLAAALALVSSGATEVVLAPGVGEEPMWVLIGLFCIAAADYRRRIARPANLALGNEGGVGSLVAAGDRPAGDRRRQVGKAPHQAR